MTTNFASSAMGGGKSLYSNHLRNLLVSISAFTVIAVMFFASSENVYSQCPPGFNGPYTISINDCPDCTVEVDYCLQYSPSTGYCNIHVMNIRFIGNPVFCSGCFPVDQYGNYVISWAEIVTHIARYPDNFNCFESLELNPCDEQLPYPIVNVTNGGCYFYTEAFNELLGVYEREYFPCVIDGMSTCHQNYFLCKEWVNGVWKIKAIAGPVTPQFQCLEDGCNSLCN